MSGGRWVEVRDERQGLRPPSWLSPGIVVAAAFLLLIVVIIIGIVITRSGGERVRDDLTIAQLRADPEGYDGVTIELTGVVTRRYTIPFLDQYGLYEFDDGTGSLFVLSDKGVPPDDGEQVRLTAVFNGAVELDDQIRNLVEDQFGSAAGFVVDRVLPGIPLNVAYLTHQRFDLAAATAGEGR